jgi:O-antigen ligase
MTSTIDELPPPEARTVDRARAFLGRWLDPAALGSRLAAFDRDPRVIGFGFLVGIAYAVLMATNIDHDHPGIARIAVAVALAAPTAGITIVATLAMFREPIGLNPLHFNASVIGAAALAVVARILLAGYARRRISIRPEFLAIGAYAGLTVFQFTWIAFDVAHPRGLWARTELTQVISGLLLILVIAVVFTPRTRLLLLAAMVPGVTVAGLVAIISISPAALASLPIAGWLPLQDISARGTGFFRNPNYLGQAMAMGLILVGRGRRMDLPGPLTRWSILLAVVVALGMIASFSRGALLAAAAGVVVLYLRRGRRAALIAGILGTVVVLIGYQLLLATRHVLTFGPAIAASAAAQAASDAARLAVYKAGILMFLHRPLFGIGYGQFHYESVKYLPSQSITFSNDVFLGVAVEQGIPGIIALVVMLGAMAYALWRSGDEVALTALSMLAVFAVGSLFAENLTSLQTSAVLWVAIGCALVLPSSVDDRTGQPGELGLPVGCVGSAARRPIRVSEPSG